MKIRKKLKITLIFAVICLVLVISASYAWLTLSLRPEITRIDTNVGANGSLEIALLSSTTYRDPLMIRTSIGDSAAEQDALESNAHWGNVIDLSDIRYGLGEISLLPARLNAVRGEEFPAVSQNLLKVAEFGIDGRISILSDSTVSAIRGENNFTYYVDQQNYGVRAIGTISNLSEQQIALAEARSLVPAHTAAAARTLKHTWRDYGAGVVDILYRKYAAENDTFSPADIAAIRNLANGMVDALNYADSAIRQGIIGIAASQISDEPEFDSFRAAVSNSAVPLSTLMNMLGSQIPTEFKTWITQIDRMKLDAQSVVANTYTLANGGTWKDVEPLLDVFLDADKAYLAENRLSSSKAWMTVSEDNRITLSPDSGILADMAAYVGNYSAFCMWTETASMEAVTAHPSNEPYLIRIEDILDDSKAATGGWTRANLDDTYGFAVDMAFRCNASSDLLLQTAATLRVEEDGEFPVTQGGGSYMRFASEQLDTAKIVALMGALRVGFLDNQNNLLAVAMISADGVTVTEDGVEASLYLYDFYVLPDGRLLITGKKEDATITALPEDTATVVSVIVWLDGDYVTNGHAGIMPQSMTGSLNLQFASTADLKPSDIPIRENE